MMRSRAQAIRMRRNAESPLRVLRICASSKRNHAQQNAGFNPFEFHPLRERTPASWAGGCVPFVLGAELRIGGTIEEERRLRSGTPDGRVH
jgi:hypothetical protein